MGFTDQGLGLCENSGGVGRFGVGGLEKLTAIGFSSILLICCYTGISVAVVVVAAIITVFHVHHTSLP